MSPFDHVGLPVAGLSFHREPLPTSGRELMMEVSAEQTGAGNHASLGRNGKPVFRTGDGAPPLQGRPRVYFKAACREPMDAFHARALATGKDAAAPNHYDALVLAPAGRDIEAIRHAPEQACSTRY
ncbi:VOC family protein [Lysobacter pythonis]|uniref:VOC family protein n=1 Tax=Solilutibacter pythonis TaxID=2483112 RepID=A0A3M2HX48_9GAMM|nr:VOC family protein [Lysobacter pythonis]RMH90777.1 VOC family protein [Lysobacter pythonis]